MRRRPRLSHDCSTKQAGAALLLELGGLGAQADARQLLKRLGVVPFYRGFSELSRLELIEWDAPQARSRRIRRQVWVSLTARGRELYAEAINRDAGDRRASFERRSSLAEAA